MVTDLLVENFQDIFDLQYTARLEEELDEIEEGKEKWTDALAEFYKKFQKDLKYAEKHMENIKRMEKPTDEKCETLRLAAGDQVGQARLVLRLQHVRQGRSEHLHVHERKSDQPARPRFGGRAGERRRRNTARTADA